MNNKFIKRLRHNGNVVIESLLSTPLVDSINNLFIKRIDLKSLEKKLISFSMGNLAIDSCALHN